MNNAKINGIVCMWTVCALVAAVIGGVVFGLAQLLNTGMVAMGQADWDSVLASLLILILRVLLSLGLIMPGWVIGFVLAAAGAIVFAAGLVWLLLAGVVRAVTATGGNRNEEGLRVAYFHWKGGWRDGWRTVHGDPESPLPWLLSLGGSAAIREREATWVRWGEGAMVPTYFALRAPMVALLCAGRYVAAAFLRWKTRSERVVHECRTCRGWTASVSWRCPGCGRHHRGVVPSAKYGLFAWQCECGARLPISGRRGMTAVCPECGGAMDPVEAGRADMAFMGAPGTGKTRLMREAVAALAGRTGGGGGWRETSPSGTDGDVATLVSEDGRRRLRLFDPAGRTFLDPADLVRQQYWGHIGAVVFAADPTDPGAGERVWESWHRVMEREHPGRMRRMACAVVLTKTDAGDATVATGLPPGAGDRQCRAFLERAGAGNLLNGLDGQFRRVRVFAAGGSPGWLEFAVEQSFRNMPLHGKVAS